MKSRIFLISLLAIVLLTVPIFIACAPTGPVSMEILAGSFGLTNYTAMVAVSEVLNKNSNIRTSVVETTGSEANIVMAEERDPNQVLFHVTDVDYWSARRMLFPWKEKHTDMRLIAGLHFSAHGIVTIDPNIQTVEDLRGKTFGMLPGPSAGTNLIFENYFKAVGIYDTMKIQKMGPGDFYDALSNGLIDAADLLGTFSPEGYKSSFLLQEVISAHGDKVHAVSFDPNILAKVIADIGLKHDVVTIPAGKLIPSAKSWVGWKILVAALAAQKDADKDLIYEITKTLAEHLDDFGKALPNAADITPRKLVDYLPIDEDAEKEVHPGAIKYYKEAGLWPPR